MDWIQLAVLRSQRWAGAVATKVQEIRMRSRQKTELDLWSGRKEAGTDEPTEAPSHVAARSVALAGAR